MRWYAYYKFVRPSLLAIICVVVATLIAQYLGARGTPSRQPATTEEQLVAELARFELPHPRLTPEDVVRVQIKSLAVDQGELGILQCRCFASPANRAATGAWPEFARMVRRPPYAALGTAESYLVGTPTIDRDTARVVVTLLDKEQIKSFIWILRKQADHEYRDCWLTDAVLIAAPPQPARGTPDGFRST
jgi:hypothetical protein